MSEENRLAWETPTPSFFDRIMRVSVKLHNFSADISKRKSTRPAKGNQIQKILMKKRG